MCRWLARTGAEVHLVAAHGPEPPGEVVDGVRIHLLPQPSGRRERMTRTRKDAWRKALSLNPDLVHFHDPELLWDRPWRANPEVRVVYDAHEDLREQVTIKKWLPLPKCILRWVVGCAEEWLSASAHGVITVDRAIVKRFPGREVTLVRNFPDLEALSDIESTDRPVNTENKWVSICAGTLGTDRGTDDLIRVFEYLSEKFELWLIGSVPSEDLAVWKSWPGWRRVRYFPRMEHKAVVGLEKSADVLIHLLKPVAQYQRASYPVKGLEGIACGIPLILSDFKNLRKTFQSAAVYVDPEEPKQVAAAIKQLSENPEQCNALCKRGIDLASNKYNWKTEFGQITRIYKNLIEKA